MDERAKRWWRPLALFCPAILVVGVMAAAGCMTEAEPGSVFGKDAQGSPLRGTSGTSNRGPGGGGNSGHGHGGDSSDNENGNDNADDNANDNADNGNDNADNGNDNGASCPDGTFRVRADLAGGGDATGEIEYRLQPGGCERFRVRIDGFAAGTYDVTINAAVVGRITADSRGRGELEFDTEDGTFPADFPEVHIGDIGGVGGLVSGILAPDCPADVNTCPGNGNDNAGDNGNNNGADNGNDNTP